MSNALRTRAQASMPKKASSIQVMHQQAQQANGAGAVVGGNYVGESPSDRLVGPETEVSRELSRLTHAIDELHLVIDHLENRLSPVMAEMPQQPPPVGAENKTESDLGGWLQGHALNVEGAINRVQSLLQAIRI